MVGIDGVVIGDDGSDQIDVPLPDDSTVFKGKTVRLRKEQSMLLLAAIAIEQKGSQVPEEIKNSEFWFVPKVIQKRIDVLGLPIKFTEDGYLAAVSLCGDNPGRGVTLLVDALTRFEGQTMTCSKVIELYPSGFYCEDTFCDYVDNYLKPRKVKWAEIY